MKIAYWAHVNYPVGSGIINKLILQINYWKEMGHHSHLFLLTRRRDIAKAIQENITCFYYHKNSWFDRLKTIREIENTLHRNRPDLIYIRQDLFYPVISRLGRKYPIVVEVNSDMGAELWTYSKLQWLYYYLSRPIYWKATSGAVFVTYELKERHKHFLNGKKTAVISNGIDLESFSVLPPPPIGSRPTFVFIGHPRMPWHGIDKIVRLSRLWPEGLFHIIGPTKEEIPDAPSNMIFHGFLMKEAYIKILAQSHIAISTLALHRKSMEEACPIKSREYLAYGLPVIAAYKDTDFTDKSGFLLRLPNKERNVEESFEHIKQFYSNWNGKRVPRQNVIVICASEKEKSRISYFQTIVKQRE